MLKIGIDLDNTIINYNSVFKKYLNKKEISISSSYKETLKKKILKDNISESKWMKIQGQTYGKNINQAKTFEGFLKFLTLASFYNVSIFIVSHKTLFGHYDKNKINLRKASLSFLKRNFRYKGEDYFSQIKSINFFDTFREKIEFINSCKFDYFIDDLPKVINRINLKKKILFNSSQNIYIKNCYNLSHWDQITKLIFKNINSNYYKKLINLNSKFNIINIKKIKSNRNSNVFQLTNSDNKKFFLKVYPHREKNLPTLLSIDREIISLRVLKKINVKNIPKLIFYDKEFNFIITSWLYGKKVNILNNLFFNNLCEFIHKINTSKQKLNKKELLSIPLAKDSVIEFDDLVSDIKTRLYKFNSNLKILPNEIKEIINTVNFLFRRLLSKNYKFIKKNNIKFKVPINKQILSPSDMGKHNTIFKQNIYSFYDFEYFGRDDPVKLICDIILNPNTFKEKILLKDFFIKFVHLFGDKSFLIRYKLTFRLHLLKWVLIILKKFAESDHRQSFNINNKQLKKSRYYLIEYNNFNSTLNLFSDIN